MEMINISDLTLKVKIANGPGQPHTITTLAPGKSAQFPDGYCRPVKGAGAAKLPCVLSRGHTHNGVPVLVTLAEAEAARVRYVAVCASVAANSDDPQAVIRRLEAELAASRVGAPAPASAPVSQANELEVMRAEMAAMEKRHAEELAAIDQEDDDLIGALTPEVPETANEEKNRKRREKTAAKKAAEAAKE